MNSNGECIHIRFVQSYLTLVCESGVCVEFDNAQDGSYGHENSGKVMELYYCVFLLNYIIYISAMIKIRPTLQGVCVCGLCNICVCTTESGQLTEERDFISR